MSCTVSKLWLIIGQIFANDWGSLHFNAFSGGDPLLAIGGALIHFNAFAGRDPLWISG